MKSKNKLCKSSIELNEITREEAELISIYLRRDLADAGKFLEQTGKELVHWLAFDWQLIEAQTWKSFLSVADKTQLEWLELSQKMHVGADYHSGEITSLGTLYCTVCLKPLNFYQISAIPACPNCHNESFKRELI